MNLVDAMDKVATDAGDRLATGTESALNEARRFYISGKISASVARLALDGAVAFLRKWEGTVCADASVHEQHQWTDMTESDGVPKDRWCPGKKVVYHLNHVTTRDGVVELNQDIIWAAPPTYDWP